MNWKVWAPLGVAVILGLVAAKVGMDVMSRSHQVVSAPSHDATVLVATGDMDAGAELRETDLAQAKVPAAGLPAGTFEKTADLVGRVVSSPLVKGQTILETLLTPAGSASGLTAIVPKGWRAVTVEVNEITGVAGLLVPGCRVDVVCSFNGNAENRVMARTVVENLKVIAVGRRYSTTAPAPAPDGGDPNANANNAPARAITLLATPHDAETLELACHIGTPRLMLRGAGDGALAGPATVTLGELRGFRRGSPTQDADYPQGDVTPVPTTLPVSMAPTTRPFEPRNYRVIEVIRAGVASSERVAVPASQVVAGTSDDQGPVFQPANGGN